ncbi:WAT1-related protein At3g28050-like [Ziziphus jujuba]|uniref:WAT1-related protein n=1 Tax=Ziziphus jujuba TaxID=326968 RepID=A0ABM4A7W0_ZIZJJ|nr:WAT1-related protein At3g28050-like [Ziziphus jujuba]
MGKTKPWNKRPPLTFSLLWRFFLVGLTGSLGKLLFFTGVKFSSPTLSSAMGNFAQIFTALLAIIFRMEKLNLRSTRSQAKSVGTVVSVAGALIVTLYKGPSLMGSSPTNTPSQLPLSQQSKWILRVFFYIFFVTIQSLVFSLILERDPVAWKPNAAIEIMAIVFTSSYNLTTSSATKALAKIGFEKNQAFAVVGSVISVSVHTWCLHKKGPVYVAMFRHLEIVFAAIMSIIFLGETIHLGSVIGSVIIVFGFYTLMWGKIKEKSMDVDNEVRNLESSSHKTPLLQSSSNEYSPRNS